MHIIGSLTSPYVRIARAVCEELDLDYQLQEIGTMFNLTPEERTIIAENNPLLKVPILVDNNKRILDSRIIANYLVRKAVEQGKKIPLNTETNDEMENIITTIYGIAEAGILRLILTKTTDLNPNEGYLKRSLTRIDSGLEYLASAPELGKTFGMAELMLICVLEFFDKRAIADWRKHPNLVALHTAHKDRASLVATRIPEGA